jgi:hypothetical protein
MPEPAVVGEAITQCSFGLVPSPLQVLPTAMVIIEGMPAATIDCSEVINIPTFGMCTTLSNPEVAAATAAALGVLTPMPCVPVLSPWIPASMTLIGGQPALVASSTCICAYGGVVEINFPGTTTTLV